MNRIHNDKPRGHNFGSRFPSREIHRKSVAGTRLVREWNGVEHTVTVLTNGFEWQGRRFKSLSAIARQITGTRWNGYRYFGLRERKQEEY